jgi:hypothetical protein
MSRGKVPLPSLCNAPVAAPGAVAAISWRLRGKCGGDDISRARERDLVLSADHKATSGVAYGCKTLPDNAFWGTAGWRQPGRCGNLLGRTSCAAVGAACSSLALRISRRLRRWNFGAIDADPISWCAPSDTSELLQTGTRGLRAERAGSNQAGRESGRGAPGHSRF